MTDFFANIRLIHQQENERRAKVLLSKWVSELGPTLAYNEAGTVIGLSYAGSIVLTHTYIFRRKELI